MLLDYELMEVYISEPDTAQAVMAASNGGERARTATRQIISRLTIISINSPHSSVTSSRVIVIEYALRHQLRRHASKEKKTMAVLSIKQRLDIHAVDAGAYAPMIALEKYVHAGSISDALIDLVKLRASQINGCAYCLAMHNEEARKDGVEQRRIDVLSAWREAAGIYSAREQAALAFTEEVTRIGESGVSDPTWDNVRAEFSDQEIVHLLMAVCAINVWNRMAISVHLDLP